MPGRKQNQGLRMYVSWGHFHANSAVLMQNAHLLVKKKTPAQGLYVAYR